MSRATPGRAGGQAELGDREGRVAVLAHGWQACWALLERDLRAFLRSRSQVYSSVLLPLMLLAILGTGVSEGLEPTSAIIRDGDYVSYLAPGMIAMTALFSSTFSSASFYRDRGRLNGRVPAHPRCGGRWPPPSPRDRTKPSEGPPRTIARVSPLAARPA